MASYGIKTKTFFSIPPTFLDYGSNVVFLDNAFSLNHVTLITECVFVRELQYQFTMYMDAGVEHKLVFDFARKQDCLMAQRELSRAWARSGEFAPLVPEPETTTKE